MSKKSPSPHVANLTRPHTTVSSCELAKQFLLNRDSTKFTNPNKNLMSRSVYDKLRSCDSFLQYNPVLVDLICEEKCVSLRVGKTKSHPVPPEDWDEEKYGSWYIDRKVDGECIRDATGWFFEKAIRRCHTKKIEKLIDNPEKNILTFNDVRYVVGDGSHNNAACFLIWQTSSENNRIGDEVRKRLSFADVSISDVVFKIEDKPTHGGVVVKGNWKHCREIVYLPGQVLTAGYLCDIDGNHLDLKTIRDFDSSIHFQGLDSPIVGKPILWKDLWSLIQDRHLSIITSMKERGECTKKYELRNTESKTITNICVNGKRVDPSETSPFGLRGSQIHQPAYIVSTGYGPIRDGNFSMGVIIGVRSNSAWNVGVHKAKTFLNNEVVAVVENDTVDELVELKN